jgi:hypothetical protein
MRPSPIVAVAITCGLAIGVVSVGWGAGLNAPTCRWRVEQHVNEAYVLAVVRPRDVWLGLGGPSTVSLEHWDGSGWRRFRIPSTKFGGIVDAVEASSAGEIWVVGPNGAAARWVKSRVEIVPTPLEDSSRLWDLSSTAPDDVWAAGIRIENAYAGHPLIEHWDGHQWKVSFTDDAFGGVSDVLALSPQDVWAVGWRRPLDPFGSALPQRPLLMHWDGRRWHRVQAPGSPPAYLDALSGRRGTIWATAEPRDHHYAFAHWDGHRWALVLGPTLKANDKRYKSGIHDLVFISPSTIVAVGSSQGRGILLRWDGTRWSSETTRSVVSWDRVDAAAGEVWAIGDPGSGGPSVISRCAS